MSSIRWKTYLVVGGLVAVMCVVAIQFLKGGSAAEKPESRISTRTAGTAWDSTRLGQSTVVHEDKGRLQLVNRVALPEVAPVREAVVDPPVHIKLGETTTLKFALRGKAPGNPSASVFHGKDEALEVDVVDVGDGTYDVPFTPNGPGQFNVVLSDGGVPIGSRKVGVVGVAGDSDNSDPDFLSVDPREPRMRSSGRASLR